MRTAIVALASILIGGCATPPKLDATPPTLPRAKPVQAMQACRTQSVTDACRFRPEFGRLDLADQLAMIGNCVEVMSAVLYECAARQGRLREWIEAGALNQ